MRRKHLTNDEVTNIRQEYLKDEQVTIEYLSAKYDRATETIRDVLNNKRSPDPTYQKPIRGGVNKKKKIYIPEHLKQIKESLTPPPTTAHRARGQNNTIARFK